LNPKVALFFLAFLPQFVLPDAPSKPLAFLFLGIIFDVNGTLWNSLVAWSTARISHRLSASRSIQEVVQPLCRQPLCLRGNPACAGS
jgi:threonine/homoserine/homoserine lactone efflux protein